MNDPNVRFAPVGCVDTDPVLRAELLHEPRALDAEPGLVRAGAVVDARVDDAAIVAGLVRGESRLLLVLKGNGRTVGVGLDLAGWG